MPGGALGFLIVVNMLVFILGCFIDFFEIAFIVMPILMPVAEKILPELFPPGTPIDPIMIWFGVILAMNLQTSFLTPPFGFALFYLRSVAAKKDYKDRITGENDPGGDHGADLQGLDRLHHPAADHGGGDHRLPEARDQRRHRTPGRDDRRRQGAGELDAAARRSAESAGLDAAGRPAPPTRGQPAAPARGQKAADDDPMKALQDAQ